MISFVLVGLLGLAVTGVVAWARGSRRAVELAEQERRARQLLNTQEAALLARLEAHKKDPPPGGQG